MITDHPRCAYSSCNQINHHTLKTGQCIWLQGRQTISVNDLCLIDRCFQLLGGRLPFWVQAWYNDIQYVGLGRLNWQLHAKSFSYRLKQQHSYCLLLPATPCYKLQQKRHPPVIFSYKLQAQTGIRVQGGNFRVADLGLRVV